MRKWLGLILVLFSAACNNVSTFTFSGTWEGTEDYPGFYADYFTRLVMRDEGGVLSGESYNCDVTFTQCVLNGPLSGIRTGFSAQLEYTFDPRSSTKLSLSFQGGKLQGSALTPFNDKTTQTGAAVFERR